MKAFKTIIALTVSTLCSVSLANAATVDELESLVAANAAAVNTKAEAADLELVGNAVAANAAAVNTKAEAAAVEQVGQLAAVNGIAAAKAAADAQQALTAVESYKDTIAESSAAITYNTKQVADLSSAFQTQATQTANDIARLDGRVNDLYEKTDKLKAGIAGATAIASLSQYVGSGSHHFAVGVGGYDGESALAAGYTYAVSPETTLRIALTLDSQDELAYGASVGHSW
ncbi:YadA C-terminal domain-containing protein [Aeromonas veronii]|uniref:YadA C-terminal domain-containing protein n=1 Tax=Aeromonas veronii TaxID=654 RepID=UPI003D1C8643